MSIVLTAGSSTIDAAKKLNRRKQREPRRNRFIERGQRKVLRMVDPKPAGAFLGSQGSVEPFSLPFCVPSVSSCWFLSFRRLGEDRIDRCRGHWVISGPGFRIDLP